MCIGRFGMHTTATGQSQPLATTVEDDDPGAAAAALVHPEAKARQFAVPDHVVANRAWEAAPGQIAVQPPLSLRLFRFGCATAILGVRVQWRSACYHRLFGRLVATAQP